MMKKIFSFPLLCFLGGVFYGVGFPGKWTPALPFAPVVGMGLLLFSLSPRGREISFKRQCFFLLAFLLGFYYFSFSWIPFTLNEFGHIAPPFNWILGLSCALVLLPHYWLYLILRKILFKRYSLPLNAACLTLLEYLIPQQFSIFIGSSWLPMAPFLALVPVFGVPLFSFMSYYMAGVVAEGFNCGKRVVHRRDVLIFLGVSMVFILANAITPLSYDQSFEKKVRLRMVQGNIDNFIKVSAERGDEEAVGEVVESYRNLSLKPSEAPLDLIIWPETAYPDFLESRLINRGELSLPPLIHEVVAEMGVELITGGYDLLESVHVLNFEDQYNALYHIDDRGELKDVYHKQLLFPFGETMPFGPLNLWLFRLFPQTSFFARGERQLLMTLRGGGKLLPIICYEVLFPRFLHGYLASLPERPHFIVNITNDSWFGDTAEPHQHFFSSRWRALELALPIVRVTNTGITAIVYPDGSLSPKLTLGEQGILDVDLPLREQSATPYERYGLWPSLLAMLAICGLTRLSGSGGKSFS